MLSNDIIYTILKLYFDTVSKKKVYRLCKLNCNVHKHECINTWNKHDKKLVAQRINAVNKKKTFCCVHNNK